MLRLLVGLASLAIECAPAASTPAGTPDSFELRRAADGCYGYELLNHGQRVWYHEFRAAVVHRSVSATGAVCAVAYNYDKDGKELCPDSRASEIAIQVLSLKGEILFDRRIARDMNVPPHWAPPQSSRGILYHRTSDCWLVQLQNAPSSGRQLTWMILDGRNGGVRREVELSKRLESLLTSKDLGAPYAELREIPDTPCVLVEWQPGVAQKLRHWDGVRWTGRENWTTHLSVLTIEGDLLLDLQSGAARAPAPIPELDRVAVLGAESRTVDLRTHAKSAETRVDSTAQIVLAQDSSGKWSCGLRNPGH